MNLDCPYLWIYTNPVLIYTGKENFSGDSDILAFITVHGLLNDSVERVRVERRP